MRAHSNTCSDCNKYMHADLKLILSHLQEKASTLNTAAISLLLWSVCTSVFLLPMLTILLCLLWEKLCHPFLKTTSFEIIHAYITFYISGPLLCAQWSRQSTESSWKIGWSQGRSGCWSSCYGYSTVVYIHVSCLSCVCAVLLWGHLLFWLHIL